MNLSLAYTRRLLVACLLLTIIVYWSGLRGPFLLDDAINLETMHRWMQGKATWAQALTSGQGMYGRPLAMASLMLSAGLGGYSPFAFKLGNLVMHLLCGGMVFALLVRVGRRDPRLESHAGVVAALIAALWLLHPLNASTVLYAVQRMAQVSTLMMLIGLWTYMVLRVRLQDTSDRRALIGIAIGIPLLTLLGFLAKENAVLLPALCLVLELGCFPKPRPRSIRWFFGISLGLPLLAGLLVFAANPARMLGGYVRRDFDWQERLLTQGRVLVDYLSKILLPNPPRMGVYTDDFAFSTGLLTPPSTLVAIVLLLAISIAAWRLRTRIPALFIGWGIFLIGHAIESSILPLELYFEHRNYLPMVGVLYAVVGLVMAAGDRLRASDVQVHRIGIVLSFGTLALLAFGTHGRARIWGDEALLVESAVASHPDSMRAQLAVVDASLRRHNLDRAAVALEAMTRSSDRKTRAQGHLNRINVSCAYLHTANPNDLQLALRDASPRIGKDESETFRLLLDNSVKPCKNINDSVLADTAAAFANKASSQPDWFAAKAELRHTAASLYARQGDWSKALPLAQLAWQPGMPAAASSVLIEAQLATGDLASAEKTYGETKNRVDPRNPQDVAGLHWLRARIDAAKKHVR